MFPLSTAAICAPLMGQDPKCIEGLKSSAVIAGYGELVRSVMKPGVSPQITELPLVFRPYVIKISPKVILELYHKTRQR